MHQIVYHNILCGNSDRPEAALCGSTILLLECLRRLDNMRVGETKIVANPDLDGQELFWKLSFRAPIRG
jgi:hypothetical protein